MKYETKERIRQITEEAIAEGTMAGVQILVRQHGEEVFYEEQGYADIENQKPIQRDTIFRLYSMSKPLTAAAAMILVDQGKLDLGQRVAEILPGFADVQVETAEGIRPAKSMVLVQHLLNMTSGLTYGDDVTASGKEITKYIESCIEKMDTEEEVSTVDFANHIGTIPLAFDPGANWHYGLSADVLGAVIEKVSGMKFGEFMQKYLFGPLGMKDTGFYVPEEKQDRLVTAYETVGKGKVVPYYGNHLVISNSMKKQPAFESGGAGLVSTIDDYSRFAQMLLNGGVLDGVRVLSKKTVEFFTHGGLNPQQQTGLDNRWDFNLAGFSYTKLMRIAADTEKACFIAGKGEYGWDGWLGCYFANLPEDDMTILLMMQKKDAGTIPYTRKVRNVIGTDLL